MVAESRLPVAVIEAIADARGVTPLELEFNLHDWIDADALNALSSLRSDDWHFVFTVDGHRVTVDGPDRILVDGEAVGDCPATRT
ncbi:HalOD1 output domain-containing protein [Halobaculum litoreum]|uniref:HalOD1 output domain-containing protein n=1 Tax=Halobaculum litoreum TaxID=3031998 RepID=UPI0024C297CA|nr:HalOD1 output domain-containing protein [Halobaculum sp. DT92]